MEMTIEVRNVYGKLVAYPVCNNACLFADIARSKTLTRRTIELARDLGYQVKATANADWSSVQ